MCFHSLPKENILKAGKSLVTTGQLLDIRNIWYVSCKIIQKVEVIRRVLEIEQNRFYKRGNMVEHWPEYNIRGEGRLIRSCGVSEV